MIRLMIATVSTLSLLPVEAQARQCKRICQDGVCWYDCSKIPGQNNNTSVFKF